MTKGAGFIGGPLQAVACDLCGSGQDRTFLTLPDTIMETSDHTYRLAECRSCGLIYLNPRPYEWEILRYYPESYAPFVRNKWSARARNWLHRRSVRELNHLIGSPNRVLDIGCGTGELLSVIRAEGNANIFGVEPSPQAARIAREERGLDVRTGTLEQRHLANQSVDTVLLSHVLEHLPSPRRTIAEIERILKPGGSLIVWVPNARSLPARLMGRYWMGWDVPRHLYAFGPGSLRAYIEQADLIPGDILFERHAIEWAWGLRLMVRERLRNERLDAFLARSHPLLAVLLTPLGVLSAALGQSGRMRLISRKSLDLPR
jgi:SAM-dependent methyltransferase